MIITVTAVGMMQLAVYQIIDMVSMRNRLMSTTQSVHMGLTMPTRWMIDGAPVGVSGIDFQYMPVHIVAVDMV
jgi:hypothetical protein